MSAAPLALAWTRLRGGWDRLAVYLPVILMGVLALGTYWLARQTPVFGPPEAAQAPTHDPDYFMRRFTVRNFDPQGRLKSEVFGAEGRHYPDTDTLEIDQPRIRSFNERGDLTVATARRALSNADASEVQLFGDAVVTREASDGPNGAKRPRLEIRSEFLHAFMATERLRSNKPVVLIRGNDRFTADSLDYDNLDVLLQMQGRVRGVISPGAPR
ncbi:MAG TPA: LPS export ABC transporter periplasmic protein LptC [Ramlibacter sp.]|nr:LPS export ABC transporter periplasmic protein LptC [Ramlibacter sp.]